MKVALVDFQSSFYDRHWAYSLIPVLRKHNAEIAWFNMADPRKLASYAPDLVLYSAYQYNLSEAVSFDASLKQSHSCKSLMGGGGAHV